jgi:hypothetical protein
MVCQDSPKRAEKSFPRLVPAWRPRFGDKSSIGGTLPFCELVALRKWVTRTMTKRDQTG